MWKPAEESNLVPFRPALQVRFRRPMPGTRATPISWRRRRDSNSHRAVYETAALPIGATSPIRGRGVRPEPPLELHGPLQSPFCHDESRPDNLRKLVPKEGLKPSTSGL